MCWYIRVIRKYACFTGRASRAELWWFVLVTVLVWVALVLVDGALGFNSHIWLYESVVERTGDQVRQRVSIGPRIDDDGPLLWIYLAATATPWLSVSARRLHDINLSGWWQALAVVPVLGWLICTGLYSKRGTSADNRFGPGPAGGPHAAAELR